MRSLVTTTQVAGFTSFASAGSRVKRKTTLLLFSVALAVAATPTPTGAAAAFAQAPQENSGIEVGQSYHNDVSPALRDLPFLRPPQERKDRGERERNLNRPLPLPLHADIPDPVIDHGLLGLLLPDVMPTTILNFDGISFPGVACFCAPPEADGAVGLTHYVQVVNEGYQVFDKTTGASVLGPTALSAIWSGFGGVCQTNGQGGAVVLYDHIANRWLISQFGGSERRVYRCLDNQRCHRHMESLCLSPRQ
jgi:hypothetical protein